MWLAHDDVLDRDVAVKVLADNWSRDNEVRRRFLSEARVLLTVDSARIVRGFQLGETEEGQPYLVMAWADRGTLDDRLRQRESEGRVFSAQETVGIAAEIAAALSDVHASGHLHRDIKPTNVLIRSTSTPRHIPGLASDETIVLGDFGLARGLDLTALTLVAGSPGFVAPEQAAGLSQIDRRADLYSLGRIMLQLLTGDAGGRATTMAAAAVERIDVPGALARLAGTGSSPPPDDLVVLITSLVANDPDDRPNSAHEVQARLDGIAGQFARPFGPPVAPPPPGGPGGPTGTQLGAPVPPARRGVGAKVVAAGVAVLLAAVAVAVALTRGGGNAGSGDSTVPPATEPVVVVVSSQPASSTAPPSSATNVATTSTVPVVVRSSEAGEIATTLPSTEPAPATDAAVTTEAANVPPPATTERPATTEPATTEPATTEPATTEPATTEPAATTSEPVASRPRSRPRHRSRHTTEPATTSSRARRRSRPRRRSRSRRRSRPRPRRSHRHRRRCRCRLAGSGRRCRSRWCSRHSRSATLAPAPIRM